MIPLLEKIKSSFVYMDGAMGTLLQRRGLGSGELPELWNISHPEIVRGIHAEYLRAGSDIISTNTFGANRIKFPSNYREIIIAGVNVARSAANEFGQDRYVAFDMGPLGKMLEPFGDLPFEEAVSVFADSVKAARDAGADLILIETMNDCYETKAALLAAKENSDLPVFVTNVYDERGKLLTGADASVMVAMLEGMGANAIGINCSLGPAQMLDTVRDICTRSSLPVIVCPNAGLPEISSTGETVYDVDSDEFAEHMRTIAGYGACILGGCCGTTPEYIAKIIQKTRDIDFSAPVFKHDTVVTSYSRSVSVGGSPVLVGERINPTGKARLKEAIRSGDMSYIYSEAIDQEERGVHILDVNVGVPGTCERENLLSAVKGIQSVTTLPLQIDTSDIDALSAAMREYNGKPLVNSVNGKEESLMAVLPLVKKYGGVVIALTLDENGIPDTAEGRLRIAEKIVMRAEKLGIDRKDIIADPLAMAVSADRNGALTTLRAISLIKEKLGIKVSLGVSNISFGLPLRDAVNSAFFASALYAGLDMAIMNPRSDAMMRVYYSSRALLGKDENFQDYIAYAGAAQGDTAQPKAEKGELSTLREAVIRGVKDRAYSMARDMLSKEPPLEVVNSHIVPALDEVGKGFEEKRIFLPQLLMSAEAAEAAFEAVKEAMARGGAERGSDIRDDNRVLLATVKGDIHDIGKNIVKALLSNYGFTVIDAGKDVPPEKVLSLARENGVRLVGLSALMTTTVPFMEETIKLLKRELPDLRVVVGGAVLTADYAEKIGADFYARDAMETVRYAQKFFGSV